MGQGEVGGCTRRVQTAWPCLGSLVERPWLALGRAISVLFGINRLRNKPSHLVGPPFLVFMAHFSAMPGWHFPRALIGSWLIGGCG